MNGKRKFQKRKKVCNFCKNKIDIDYKDVPTLKRYTTERGKLLSRKITGCCAKHQRQVTTAVKRARIIALLPFVNEDATGRAKMSK